MGERTMTDTASRDPKAGRGLLQVSGGALATAILLGGAYFVGTDHSVIAWLVLTTHALIGGAMLLGGRTLRRVAPTIPGRGWIAVMMASGAVAVVFGRVACSAVTRLTRPARPGDVRQAGATPRWLLVFAYTWLGAVGLWLMTLVAGLEGVRRVAKQQRVELVQT